MVVDVREGQAYKITNARGGTVIDLSGAGERAPITGYNFHDGPNQRVRGASFVVRRASCVVGARRRLSPISQ